jgi:hypothetical protein
LLLLQLADNSGLAYYTWLRSKILVLKVIDTHKDSIVPVYRVLVGSMLRAFALDSYKGVIAYIAVFV